MTPTELAEELCGVLLDVCKSIYLRTTPVTAEEWDTISDRVLRLAEQEKAKLKGESKP